jgi:hypothetical protein
VKLLAGEVIFGKQFHDPVGIVRAIGENVGFGYIHLSEHLVSGHGVMTLTLGQFKPQWISERIHKRMNLGG